ncbi:hypothetical protein EHS25_002577 [Saitozyma podzolica]|uniref:HpcH/HpaI aldolase/citrate lyase domain-containing protein n=1 Tax=Saitozyma podzolica TaxID=1890683 RepID=A0A427YCP7_9TREE|nr:hypothetical protein EHS25_002577 [Saitozyma podzolica]
MDKSTHLRNVLAQKKPAVGFALTLASPPIIRAALAPRRFSWVMVDGEHGLITDEHYYNICTHVASCGASPIIRIPVDAEWMIKRALDAGAHGDDARRIVGYSKYPPNGSRGYGPSFCPHAFDVPDAVYPAQADENLLVVVQIESPQAVRNVQVIAEVPGVDIIFIGPYDLSKQMGVAFGGEEHEAALQSILDATKKAGKTAAIYCANGSAAKKRLDQGFDMVTIGTELGAITAEFERQVDTALGAGAGQRTRVY